MSIKVNRQNLSALLVGVLVFSVYIYTAPPGLTWDLGGSDGGELAAAVYSGGLVHSPGYPTYLITAQITHLFPFAESFAYRLNLFSALCMSMAAAVLAYTCQLRIPHWTSLIPPILMAAMPLVWSQAIITEVYALAMLFCTIICSASFWLHETHMRQRYFLFGILIGLGIGSHYLTLLATTFVVLQLLANKKSRSSLFTPQFVTVTASGLIVGLLPFLYLPLRAGTTTHSNWGNPNTFENFYWVITAAAYAGRAQLAHIPTYITAVLGSLIQNIGLIGTIVAAYGLSNWWENDKPLFWSAMITIAGNILIVSAYDSADVLPYLYPALIILMIALTDSMDTIKKHLTTNIENTKIRSTVTIGLVLIILIPTLIAGWNKAQSATTEAEFYNQRIISQVEPNSVVLTQGTAESFALRYASVVTHPDQDILVIDRDLWEGQAWYRQDSNKAIGYPADQNENGEIDSLVQNLITDGRILYTTSDTMTLSITHTIWTQVDEGLWRLRSTDNN